MGETELAGRDYNDIFARTVPTSSLFIRTVTAPTLKNFHFVCSGGISPKSECLKSADPTSAWLFHIVNCTMIPVLTYQRMVEGWPASDSHCRGSMHVAVFSLEEATRGSMLFKHDLQS